MPAFTYSALDQQGKEKKGVVEADNAYQARQNLRAQKLTPLEVNSVATKTSTTKRSYSLKWRNGLKAKELNLITRQLATLLAAGLPLTESLQTIAEQSEQHQTKRVVMGVRAGIAEGHSFAASLAKFPHAFPPIYRATISAGEQSGNLDKILERLADFTEKQQRSKLKIQQALIYPSLLTGVSILIVSFLLTYVVPRIVNVFQQTGQSLPDITKTLIFISQFVKSYGIIVVIITLLAGYGLNKFLQHNRSARFKLHQLLLHMPLLGSTLKTVNTARFARSLSILTAATVPILEAMNTSNRLITLLPLRQAVEIAIAKVREGSNMSRALQQTHYFPPMSIHLISSGEASGQLASMLERAADNQERDVAAIIDSVVTLFEPLLIICMGAIILFIVLATLLPIFALDQFTG